MQSAWAFCEKWVVSIKHRRSSIFFLRQMNLFVWQMRARAGICFSGPRERSHTHKNPCALPFLCRPGRKMRTQYVTAPPPGLLLRCRHCLYTWETHPVGISASNAVLCETKGAGWHVRNFYDVVLLTMCISLKGKVSPWKVFVFLKHSRDSWNPKSVFDSSYLSFIFVMRLLRKLRIFKYDIWPGKRAQYIYFIL